MSANATKPVQLTHGTYEEALDHSLKSAGLTDVDAAMVHNVRAIARTLDEAERAYLIGSIDTAVYFKSMYLTPHFVSGLRELLMTPMARATGQKPSQPKKTSRLKDARDAEQQRQRTAA